MLDAHHHLWNFHPEEYGWIPDSMAMLRRDFGPVELEQALADGGVSGTVAVQARTDVRENDFLLAAAAATPRILGVVGWVDLAAPDAGEHLAALAGQPKIKGVREVIQGAPDARFFLNPDFHRGVREVTRLGLAYDLLVFADQLPAATTFVDAHPEQRMVLDHAGKPPLQAGTFPADWDRAIRELARRPHVCVKLSGLVTESREPGWAWDEELLRPVVDTLLESFGPERMMFGSDWPVCLPASGYARWTAAVRDLVGGLAPAESHAIFEGTARAFYRL